MERLGLGRVSFELAVENGSLLYRRSSMHIAGLPLPSALSPAMHAVMGIVYGAFLAFLIPQMIGWSKLGTGFGPSYHGFPAWMLLVLAAGVFASGIRDLVASARPAAA